MNHLDNYLPQDIEQAARELRCYWDMMRELEQKFAQGDLQGSIQAATDIIKSVNVLKELQERKRRNDELNQVVIQLQVKGVLQKAVQQYE